MTGRLARFEAHPSPLESDQGFLNVFSGDGNYDVDAIQAAPGSEWDLDGAGPIFKVYTCCGLVHSGIDGALDLRQAHAIRPGRYGV